MTEVLHQSPILILRGVKLLRSQGCSLVDQTSRPLICIHNSGADAVTQSDFEQMSEQVAV